MFCLQPKTAVGNQRRRSRAATGRKAAGFFVARRRIGWFDAGEDESYREAIVGDSDSEESTTAGGILLMSSSENAGPGSSICGSVASVGAECKTVKQGDSVLINGSRGRK